MRYSKHYSRGWLNLFNAIKWFYPGLLQTSERDYTGDDLLYIRYQRVSVFPKTEYKIKNPINVVCCEITAGDRKI